MTLTPCFDFHIQELIWYGLADRDRNDLNKQLQQRGNIVPSRKVSKSVISGIQFPSPTWVCRIQLGKSDFTIDISKTRWQRSQNHPNGKFDAPSDVAAFSKTRAVQKPIE
jgi:hypothetical protein